MIDHLPDDAELIELAGNAPFERGRGYHAAGRVTLSQVSTTALVGEARGVQDYGLWLKLADNHWRWSCSCPAADNGGFCKHLVAAVLTARGAPVQVELAPESEAGKAPPRSRVKPRTTPGELLEFLRAQPVERLANWLQALAGEDRNVEKRLLRYRAAEQPGALKDALAKLINTGGFLDYHRANAYADRLGMAVEQLSDLLLRDPGQCRELSEYALGRLFKIYMNSDDSAGAIGALIRSMADLHARACAAAPPGVALAKTLHGLIARDEWGIVVLANYWGALGSQGQAAYSKRVLAEFERQAPARTDGGRDSESFSICRRTEELARCLADFDLLQRVLRHDLSSGWQHFRVLESLREFGRAREALAWAESAIKLFPSDGRLRVLLAQCLLESGMDEEALDQAWLRFHGLPDNDAWDALKRIAGTTWPACRQRALDEMAARESGNATARVELLLHDGDAAAAVALVADFAVSPYTLHALAQQLRRSDPAMAGMFYLRLARHQADNLGGPSDYSRLVAHLKDVSRLLPTEAWQPLLEYVRVTHVRKTKLMGLLLKAGL